MRAFVIAAVVTASAVSATAHAGGAVIAIPPAEVDYGFDHFVGGGGAVDGPATELLAGVHWASFAWYPTSFDVGVGFVDARRDVVPGYAARIIDGGAPEKRDLDLKGGYLSFARTFHPAQHPHWRTWISARGELLHGSITDGRSLSALGGALRIQSELYVHGTGGGGGAGGGGIVSGALAIGVYVEASHREIAPELGPDSITSGVSIRLPFILLAGG